MFQNRKNKNGQPALSGTFPWIQMRMETVGKSGKNKDIPWDSWNIMIRKVHKFWEGHKLIISVKNNTFFFAFSEYINFTLVWTYLPHTI